MISGVIVKITSDTPLSTHDRIRARFDEYGNVAYVDVIPGSDTGYVRFSNQSGAQKAIEMEGMFKLELLTGREEDNYWEDLLQKVGFIFRFIFIEYSISERQNEAQSVRKRAALTDLLGELRSKRRKSENFTYFLTWTWTTTTTISDSPIFMPTLLFSRFLYLLPFQNKFFAS